MKKLFLMLAFLMPIVVLAQLKITDQGTANTHVQWVGEYVFGSSVKLPKVCGTPSTPTGKLGGVNGLLVYDTCGKVVYVYNGSAWVSTSVDTNSLSSRINANKDSAINKYSAVIPQGYNINVGGDVSVTDSAKGLVLKDETGAQWRFQISSLGTLSAIYVDSFVGVTSYAGIVGASDFQKNAIIRFVRSIYGFKYKFSCIYPTIGPTALQKGVNLIAPSLDSADFHFKITGAAKDTTNGIWLPATTGPYNQGDIITYFLPLLAQDPTTFGCMYDFKNTDVNGVTVLQTNTSGVFTSSGIVFSRGGGTYVPILWGSTSGITAPAVSRFQLIQRESNSLVRYVTNTGSYTDAQALGSYTSYLDQLTFVGGDGNIFLGGAIWTVPLTTGEITTFKTAWNTLMSDLGK